MPVASRRQVKFHYEIRFPEQGEPLVSRAIVLATSEPQGPVYLSLPREPLMAPIELGQLQPVSLIRPTASPAHPKSYRHEVMMQS